MKNLTQLFIAFCLYTGGIAAQKDSTSDVKERPFQFTFFTPLGSNGIESYKITNRVSLNMLVGVSRGLNGFEAGGIANVILKDVKGAQFAGVTNIVLGEVKGVQFAGYFNYSGKNFKGAAFAGACNFNLGEMDGAQVAGGLNFNRKGGKGVQVASSCNIVLGNFKGVQIASGVNIATQEINGAQISAGVNYAKKVKGVQIGIVNIADTVDGATIGLLNIVRKGKHQIEFSVDELFYANLSYRMGTQAFHNIFTAGIQPGSKDNLWHIGYGAGTSFKLKNKLNADISVTAHHVNRGGFYWGTSELTRLYLGVEYKVLNKFSFAAGPTFNFYLSDNLLSGFSKTTKDVAPYYSFNENTGNDFNVKGWVGGRIALRFL